MPKNFSDHYKNHYSGYNTSHLDALWDSLLASLDEFNFDRTLIVWLRLKHGITWDEIAERVYRSKEYCGTLMTEVRKRTKELVDLKIDDEAAKSLKNEENNELFNNFLT